MSSETHHESPELREEQLCTSCTAPNDPAAHFCAKCGAPLSSYATFAPFERMFAEGFIYRQATERPRSWITVLGVWIIFGTAASFGLMTIWLTQEGGFGSIIFGDIFGGAVILFSFVMIWKSTRNYLTRKQAEQENDGGQT